MSFVDYLDFTVTTELYDVWETPEKVSDVSDLDIDRRRDYEGVSDISDP